jgi:hypothetical protein
MTVTVGNQCLPAVLPGSSIVRFWSKHLPGVHAPLMLSIVARKQQCARVDIHSRVLQPGPLVVGCQHCERSLLRAA